MDVGPAYESCRAAARVAKDFETSRRRDLLSFQHHREVAALPPNEADGLVRGDAEAALNARTTRGIREVVEDYPAGRHLLQPSNTFCRKG